MPENDPSLTPRCTRCGSDAIIPDAALGVKDYTTEAKLLAVVFTKPDALMMKGPKTSPVRVRICGDCGLVETSAEDPRHLWDAYVERLSREFGS